METLARCDALVFDKTGTLTGTESAGVEFVAVPSFDPLTNSGEVLVARLVRHSTHPISQKISGLYAHHPATDLTDVEEFPGEGLAGWFGECEIRLGKAAFAGAPEGLVVRRDGPVAHLSLGGQYRGYFLVKTAYRPGVGPLLDA